jgi:hypothetical protein
MIASTKSTTLPSFFRVRRSFAGQMAEVDVTAAVSREMGRSESAGALRLAPGERVAVAVGSRVVTDLATIVAALVAELVRQGCEPFLVPAMGSHGGATPAGQEETLARLGITEQSTGALIRSQARVLEVARTESGLPVYADKLAARADAVIPVNRVTIVLIPPSAHLRPPAEVFLK